MTVVVGFLPTPEGHAALAEAAATASARGASLVIVNSAHGSAYADSALAPEEDLESAADAIRAKGVDVDVRRLPRGQDPAEEVLAVVADVDAELLVIGIRHRSAVGKLLMGSNAQRLLLQCPCPVLAVKARL
jgi:nucleotide-binding universal stress UspA family protein